MIFAILCLLLAGAPAYTAHQLTRRTFSAPDGQQQQQQVCRNGTRWCGRCVRLTDPAACGPACTRCPKPAAGGIATCSRKGVCGVSCAKGYERAAADGNAAAVECRVCGANTFKAVAGPGLCSPCPAGTFTTGDLATDHDEQQDCSLGCEPGMQLEGASCVVCPANTTKAGTNADRCQPCPDGSRTFGNNASDHDDPGRDCYAGNTGSSQAESLLDFEDEIDWALANTGARGTRKGTHSRKTACLYACNGTSDESFSTLVAHIAGSPTVYASNDSSLVRSGVNLVSAVRNQQTCGTCVSHALASAAETAAAAAMRIDARDLNISHTFSFFCANYFSEVQGAARSCNSGWTFQEALAAMEAAPAAFVMNSSCLAGVDPVALIRINVARLKPFCTANVPAECKPAGFKCDSARVGSLAEIQRSIRMYGSVVTRVQVTGSFISFFKENPQGIFDGSLSPDEQSFAHAVQLIGYNNEQMFWLAKNSWGSDWGDQGLFRIAYGAAEVGHPEDTFALYDCFTTSKEPATVAAWSDRWPVVADDSLPDCVLYTATARDTISGIVSHFQVDILAFVNDNTMRGVIPTLELGEPPRPEPQLQPNTSWAGTVFRVCGIPSDIYDRVAADPCTTNATYCNSRQTRCDAGRCVCPERYAGRFCEFDIGVQRNFSLPNGQAYVMHLEPRLSWIDAQQRCERDGMRLARLYNTVHASEVYRQVKPATLGLEDVWIGLNDRRREGEWTWVGGNSSSDASETPNVLDLWWEGEPNNVGSGEDCAMFWTYRVFPEFNVLSNWNDAECDAHNFFLCGPAEESSDPCARFPCSSGGTRPAVGCVAAADRNNSNSINGRECLCDAGMSYVSDELGCVAPPAFDVVEFQIAGVEHALFVSPSTTWTEADRICRSRGMNLVKITNASNAQQLHQTVIATLRERGVVDKYAYWIGLNDRASEDSFVWASDGRTARTYNRWNSLQPDNRCYVPGTAQKEHGTCRVPGEDCVVVGQSGLWSDERCWSTARFVCAAG